LVSFIFQHDTPVLHELVRCLWHFVALKISRGRHHQFPGESDPSSHQRTVYDLALQNGQVQPSLNQIMEVLVDQ
jgi:hypothetical protein